MLGRTATLALVATLSACAHVPDKPTFDFERSGDNDECAWPEGGDERHTLWARYCDVREMADTYFHRGQAHARAVDGKNWLTFAGAIYAGTTFLLNPDGLSDGEITDLREAAVGVGVLQLTNQVYNPIQSRDVNLRAYHAYSCVAETTRSALEREVYVRRAGVVHDEIRGEMTALQAIVEQESGLQVEVKALAAETIVAARAELDRADQQVFAYYNFPNAVVRARDSIHEAVVAASLRNELSYATLIQAMSSTVQANMAFLDKPEPPESPAEPTEGEEGPDEADIDPNAEARESISKLIGAVAESQRITPNIVTLSANLGQCTAVMTTGVRPSAPTLTDIGPGRLPPKTAPFLPTARVNPTREDQP